MCATAFAQAPWKTNLLTNGSAETGNFDGWTKTTNGGSGWGFGNTPDGGTTLSSPKIALQFL